MVQMEKRHRQEGQIGRLVSELRPMETASSAEVGDREGYRRSRWEQAGDKASRFSVNQEISLWFVFYIGIMNNIYFEKNYWLIIYQLKPLIRIKCFVYKLGS